MCYKYPGPRCSPHAAKLLERRHEELLGAVATENQARSEFEGYLSQGAQVPAKVRKQLAAASKSLKVATKALNDAQREYDSTPKGTNVLLAQIEDMAKTSPQDWTPADGARFARSLRRLQEGTQLRRKSERLHNAAMRSEGKKEVKFREPYDLNTYDTKAALNPSPIFIHDSKWVDMLSTPEADDDLQVTEGSLRGVALFAKSNGVSIALPSGNPEQKVQGEIVEVEDYRFAHTLVRLDRAYHFRGHEDKGTSDHRIMCTITTKDGTDVRAWAYLAGQESRITALGYCSLVESGSMRDYLAKNSAAQAKEN